MNFFLEAINNNLSRAKYISSMVVHFYVRGSCKMQDLHDNITCRTITYMGKNGAEIANFLISPPYDLTRNIPNVWPFQIYDALSIDVSAVGFQEQGENR